MFDQGRGGDQGTESSELFFEHIMFAIPIRHPRDIKKPVGDGCLNY